jgi:hypothetical protein
VLIHFLLFITYTRDQKSSYSWPLDLRGYFRRRITLAIKHLRLAASDSRRQGARKKPGVAVLTPLLIARRLLLQDVADAMQFSP